MIFWIKKKEQKKKELGLYNAKGQKGKREQLGVESSLERCIISTWSDLTVTYVAIFSWLGHTMSINHVTCILTSSGNCKSLLGLWPSSRGQLWYVHDVVSPHSIWHFFRQSKGTIPNNIGNISSLHKGIFVI